MKEWTPEWLVNKFQNVKNGDNVLIGIEDVPWKTLNHAYGTADDVPALLRAIFSENHDHGDFALELLFGRIWHQGTVYQATRFVPPFLIQILQSDSVFLKHKISVIQLLESMANGNSYIDVHYSTAEKYYKIYKKEETNYEDALERELGDVKLARKSVLDEKESLLRLLDHPNEELTCNIYLLLGGFREFSSELFPDFVERYTKENREGVKNAILEAIRNLILARIDKEAFFRIVFERESKIELRAVAALALIETQMQSYDVFVMDVLLDFVRYRVDNEEKIDDMPSWKFVRDSTTSIRAISRALIELSSSSNLVEFRAFIALLKNPDQVFEFVQDLFFYLYRDDRHKDIFSVHSSKNGRKVRKYCRHGLIEVEITDPMDPLKIEFIPILKMVLVLPLFWEVESNLLNVFGIPHSKDDIAELIEKFDLDSNIA